MTRPATVAVVLAAGRGTRMQRPDATAALDGSQAAAAARGLKAMIPDARGRPFLDHVLSALADTGMDEVGVVVPPDHDEMASHYRRFPPRRIRMSFIIQAVPTGTAHAILACEGWVGGREFLSLNADNLYEPALLRSLAAASGCACAAFDPDELIRRSNFGADRVAAFALLRVSDSGMVTQVIEKPDASERRSAPDARHVSMNVWKFTTEIFDACRAVPISTRGEFELPEAVGVAIERGVPVRAVPTDSGVLDLSSRGDVAGVATMLATREAHP